MLSFTNIRKPLFKSLVLSALCLFSSTVWAQWTLYEETSIDGTTGSLSSDDVLKTTSGNVYRITSGYEYEYQYRPDLMVLTNGYEYRLLIEGFDEKFEATCLTCSSGTSNWEVFEETSVNGTLSSVSSGTTIETIGGRIYEVTSGYDYEYEYNPDLLVLKSGAAYQLVIKGFDSPFDARCLTCNKARSNVRASNECQRTFIKAPTPFHGNGGESIVLADGSVWKEVSYQYLYLYEYSPSVIICPNRGLMLLGDHKFQVVPRL